MRASRSGRSTAGGVRPPCLLEITDLEDGTNLAIFLYDDPHAQLTRPHGFTPVAVDAPLGQALLHRHVDDITTVRAPRHPYSVRIDAAQPLREEAGGR